MTSVSKMFVGDQHRMNASLLSHRQSEFREHSCASMLELELVERAVLNGSSMSCQCVSASVTRGRLGCIGRTFW